jgi:protease I
MAKVAICIAPDYEDSELDIPRERLWDAGHDVVVVGTRLGKRGYSPDQLRLDGAMVELVRDAAQQQKLVAAVCHGPQLLIEADVARNHDMTSWPSVKRDLRNAGARWKDQAVVEDGIFITAGKPEDLEAFSDAILRWLEMATRASLAS